MKKLFAISLIAMTAVSAANAEIASKAYVDDQRDAAVTSANTNTSNKIGTLATNPSTNQPYATVADAIAAAVTNGTSNVVTYSGSNNVGAATTPVYVEGGVVKAGTALGTASTATLETTGVEANGTTVPTSGQVATYVTNAISNLNANDTYEIQANKATDMTATFADDTKYPSAKAVKTALGLKADSTDIANMVTHSGAVGNATTPVYVNSDGTVAAGTALGTASTATLETTGIEANGTTVPTSGQVASYVASEIGDLNLGTTYEALANKSTAANAVTDASGANADTKYPTVGGAKAIADAEINALNLGTTYATKAEVGDTATLTTTYGSGNDTVVKALGSVKTTADAAIPAPGTACTNLNAKCVLTVGSDGYAWEVVQRGEDE